VTESNHQPHVKAKKSADFYVSPIWVLPILALIITAWLIIRVTLDAKIPITIEMPSAEGIVAGKTQLKYRGIRAGVVKSIELTEDLTRVIVHAEIEPNISRYLTTATQFWVVRAQISLAGVSGLETVLGGDYLAFEPDENGESTRHFTVLKVAPLHGEDDPGLKIRLSAENLGSVSEGTQLYYREIPVGTVRHYQLSKDNKSVIIHALVDEQYSNLVNESTVFWNSGGIQMKGSLAGFELRSESLAAILAGGISLFTPDLDALSIGNSSQFELHEDYDSAGVGIPIEIQFSSGFDLKSGITKVNFQGINIGHLDSIRIATLNGSNVIATVIIDPGAETLLNSQTQFWLVKPNLSLSNLSNLSTLISGNYITLKVGSASDNSRSFVALDGPPPPDFSEPGLHLSLRAKSMGSLALDTPVLYKGVEVGRIANILLDDLSSGIGLHLQIKPEYSQLVNESSRFWEVSGVQISAGLGGIKVKSESMMTLVKGGIAFDTPVFDAMLVDDGHEFYLLDEKDGSSSKITATLQLKTAEYLSPGVTKIKFNGFEVGTLRTIHYQAKTQTVQAVLGIDPRFKDLLKEGSIFWLVKPQIRASSIQGLDSLIGGAYFAIQPGKGEPIYDFVLSDNAPALDWSVEGLHLVLTADSAASIQVGSGVYFQELRVGSVQAVKLAETGDGVEIQIHIQPEYASHVKSHSQFYNVSGISVTASAQGLKIQSSSIDSLLSGGIAFDTNSTLSDSEDVNNGDRYSLFQSQQSAKAYGFPIVLEVIDNVKIAVGTEVAYKGVNVGVVTKSTLIASTQNIELTVIIKNEMRDLIRSNSKFWLAKTKLGLVRQQYLENLISGPTIMLTPSDGQYQEKFKVFSEPPVIKSKRNGLNLILESKALGSIQVGVPVLYRQIKVGEVLGYELSGNATSVLIFINISQRYRNLIRSNTKFWNASGIDVEMGLLSGVKIKSDSLETILSGGVVFSTPNNSEINVEQGHQFFLYATHDPDWLDWTPEFTLEPL